MKETLPTDVPTPYRYSSERYGQGRHHGQRQIDDAAQGEGAEEGPWLGSAVPQQAWFAEGAHADRGQHRRSPSRPALALCGHRSGRLVTAQAGQQQRAQQEVGRVDGESRPEASTPATGASTTWVSTAADQTPLFAATSWSSRTRVGSRDAAAGLKKAAPADSPKATR